MRAGPYRAAVLQRNSRGPSFVADFTRGYLPAGMILTRPSAGTVYDSAGNLQSAANDVPRFDYGFTPGAQPLGLLIEGQQTNVNQNPGAEHGAAGVWPDRWTLSGAVAGLTITPLARIAAQSSGVLRGLRVSITGTPTASGAFTIQPDALTAGTAAAGQPWSAFRYMRLFAGSQANLVIQSRIVGRDSSSAPIQTSAVPRTLTSALAYYSETITAGVISYCSSDVWFGATAGQPVNCTLEIVAPNLVQGPPCSPILPAIGAQAATTRAQDTCYTPLGSWFNPREGTLIARSMTPFVGIASSADGELLRSGTSVFCEVILSATQSSPTWTAAAEEDARARQKRVAAIAPRAAWRTLI